MTKKRASSQAAHGLRRSALAFTAGLLACSAALAQPGAAANSPSQRSLFETYQTCATLGLPEDFRSIRDAETAATIAVDRCRMESLALAGQYALDNPGSPDIHRFIDGRRQQLIATLSQWIAASTKGPAPHPLTPISTGIGGHGKPVHIPRNLQPRNTPRRY